MSFIRIWPAYFASLYILVRLMAYSLTGEIWGYSESLSIWLEFSVFGVAIAVSTTLVFGWFGLRPETDDPDRLDKFAAEAAKMRRWGAIAVSIIAAWALVRFLVSAAAG